MSVRPPMTMAGAERLRGELERLRSVERPRVIRAIGDAREHGDLRENAEYHAAREEQSFLEGRIAEIESQLARAQIVDPAAVAAGGRVVFGATVSSSTWRPGRSTTTRSWGARGGDHRKGGSPSPPPSRAPSSAATKGHGHRHAPGGEREYEIVGVEYR